MARTGFDPSATNDATAKKTVGGLYTNRGKEYRYWQLDATAVDTSLGQVMTFVPGAADVLPQLIACSANDPSAGIAVGVISIGNFGFFQVSGDGQVQVDTDNVNGGLRTGAAGQASVGGTADLASAYVGIQVAPIVGSLALCSIRIG